MDVHCYPVSPGSKYVPLLFDGIEDRYRPICDELSFEGAVDDLDRSGDAILHFHWEEFVLRDCRSEADADSAVRRFVETIEAFHRGGGTVFWTVHNELPHEIGFHRQFLVLRGLMARLAQCILVHNGASIDALSRQVELDRARVRMLPHPSYLGRYESEDALQAGLGGPHDGTIQCFGWIRTQKGISEMIGMLPADFLAQRDLRIRVSGHGDEAGAVIAMTPNRADVEWDVRHVPDEEAASLLRAAACVVLPYERVLTSGVALLAMSVGAVLVAVDIPQMRELLPAENARFLYPRGDGGALRARIDGVLSLTSGERADLIAANIAACRRLHPRLVARRLAALYDARERIGGASRRSNGHRAG